VPTSTNAGIIQRLSSKAPLTAFLVNVSDIAKYENHFYEALYAVL
jgi:hypothetical protein